MGWINIGVALLLCGCHSSPASEPIRWEVLADSVPPIGGPVVVLGDAREALPIGWETLEWAACSPHPNCFLQRSGKLPGGRWGLAVVLLPVARLPEPHLFWNELRRLLRPGAPVWVLEAADLPGPTAPYAWQAAVASAGWRTQTRDTLAVPGYRWLRASP